MDSNENQFVMFSKRNEWQDITPIPQDDGPNPVVVINYNESYRDAMGYLRAVSVLEEYSARTLELTSYLITINPSHYTIWKYRQDILAKLETPDLQKEVEWLNSLYDQHPKSYQSWHHRMWLVDWMNRLGKFDLAPELDFAAMAIVDDAKNYHAWSYRQWLVQKFNLWNEELDFVTECIKVDVRNNSAWNQRYFVFTKGFHPSLPRSEVAVDSDEMTKEVNYVLSKVTLALSNESPWSYLRGILEFAYGSVTANPFTVKLLALCKNYIKSKTVSLHVYTFLLNALEEQYRHSMLPLVAKEGTELCRELELKIDPMRANYWAFRASKFC